MFHDINRVRDPGVPRPVFHAWFSAKSDLSWMSVGNLDADQDSPATKDRLPMRISNPLVVAGLVAV